MKRSEIQQLLEELPSYSDPANAQARKEFEYALRNLEYRSAALVRAWARFLNAWPDARKAISTLNSPAMRDTEPVRMAPVPDLSNMLREARERLGLTVRDVEERSGVNKSMVCRLETGTLNNPPLRVMRALTKVYGLSPKVWFE